MHYVLSKCNAWYIHVEMCVQQHNWNESVGVYFKLQSIHVHIHTHTHTHMHARTHTRTRTHRSSEIDDVIEQQLKDNCGFVENFARGTAHMFK